MKEYKFKTGEVIHCRTEQEDRKIRQLAHKQGYMWNTWDNSEPFNEKSEWHIYEENTCINVVGGTYGPIRDYIIDHYNIVEASDIIDPVGYKLNKAEYSKTVAYITGLENEWNGFKTGRFNKHNESIKNYQEMVNKLKKADVLDKWFEPILEHEYKEDNSEGLFDIDDVLTKDFKRDTLREIIIEEIKKQLK